MDAQSRSSERNAILQDRFIERMYEKTHADPRSAVPLAAMHARESSQAIRDELSHSVDAAVHDVQEVNRKLALEVAKIQQERERPRADATSHMDMGV